MRLVALALLASVAMVGCNGIQINPVDAVAGIHSSSTIVTSIGLQALSKDPVVYENLKTCAINARNSINTIVLPFLNGAAVGQTTRDAVDFTLELFGKSLDPTIKEVIQTVINVALSVIKMPENPTDKLTADQRAMLIALFTGMVDGINEFIAIGPPVTARSAKAIAPKTQKLTLSGTK